MVYLIENGDRLMEKIYQRKSNYELMRIVLMFMIVFWHLIVNIIFSHNTTAVAMIFCNLLHYLLIIHIDAFVILTGYFQSSKEKISIKKIIKMNNHAYFYKIVFLLIFLIFGIKELSSVEIFRIIQPITLYGQYWFITIYILLYIVSPYINMLLNKFTKKQYRNFIITLFLISSIIPTITHEMAYPTRSGFSLLNFILLYSIGAYFKKYPIDKSIILSRYTSDFRRVIYLSIFILCALMNFLTYYFSFTLIGTENKILCELANIITGMRYAYNNPITIIEASAFFLYFGEFKINSKLINSISRVMLDVYFIHDNELVRKLYTNINSYTQSKVIRLRDVFYFLVAALCIFIICIIIGYVRILLFKIINYLPIIKKKKEKYNKKMKALGFDIT